MSSPIIESVVPSKTTVNSGETFLVKINATDPDNASRTLVGRVRDSSGNQAELGITIILEDALSFALIDADGAGFIISQDPTDPSLFSVKAP